jgi:hypothetical protein
MRVDQIMSRPVHVCRAEDSLARAAWLMWEHDVGPLASGSRPADWQALPLSPVMRSRARSNAGSECGPGARSSASISFPKHF